MAQVNVTINGRQLRMACEDGQEDHLLELAKALDDRIVRLRGQFGEIGDNRLTVMAAITVQDDLSEADARIRALEAEVATLHGERESAATHAQQTGGAVVAALNSASERIEAVAKRLNRSGNGNGGIAQG